MSKKKNQSKQYQASSSEHVAKDGHTLMMFSEDKICSETNELIYLKGEVCQVPNDKVMRWMKRGGDILGDGKVWSEEGTEEQEETPVMTSSDFAPQQ